MKTTGENVDTLETRMKRRMRELGITWAEVLRRTGGMSRNALLEIRKGNAVARGDTRRRLEIALELAPGGFDQMERGEEPAPASAGGLPTRPSVARMSSRETWLRHVLDQAEKIEVDAGRDAADAYVAGAIARRREDERRMMADRQGEREIG